MPSEYGKTSLCPPSAYVIVQQIYCEVDASGLYSVVFKVYLPLCFPDDQNRTVYESQLADSFCNP